MLFLRSVASFFEEQRLADHTLEMLAASSFLLSVNMCLGLATIFVGGGDPYVCVASLFIPIVLYVWLFVLVTRVRRALPVRDRR